MPDLQDVLKSFKPEVDFTQSNNFLEDGLLDSFDVIALTEELEDSYGISIKGTDILPEHFSNVASIEALIAKSRS